MRKLPRHTFPLLVIILSIFAIKSLLVPGFFPIHDDEQIGRLYELNKSVQAGHIPPRIAQDLGFGYGYPLFNFYPPFVYYIAEIFVLVGFSYIVSIKLMIGIGFLLAALFMYLFSKEYFGKWGGLVAAVLYTYAPYHAVDVYVRGALPEFWSFVFVPLLFHSLIKLSKTGKYRYMVLGGIAGALLILTHNLVAMMSSLFIVPYVLYLLYRATHKKKFILQLILIPILGLSLSAYFWLPAYFEKQYTMVDLLTTELANYKLHFVCVKQFWLGSWGYGGSLLGCEDGLSFQVGRVQLIGSVVALAAATLIYIRRKKIEEVIFLFGGFFLFSLFIQTTYSTFIWNVLPPFSYIQFPWRFLIFSAFTSAFLVGGLISLISNKKIAVSASMIIIILSIISVNGYFAPQKFLTNVTDKDYINLDTLEWYTSKMAFEYVPKGIKTEKSDLDTTVVAISKSQVRREPITVITGNMHIKSLIDLPQMKKFDADVMQAGKVSLNTYTFPGWRVSIDGKTVSYDDNNDLKLIEVVLPQGHHSVIAEFQDTPLRKSANYISIAAFVSLILLGCISLYQKKTARAKVHV